MRYVIACAPIEVLDPITDRPALAVPWTDAVRLLFRDTRLTQQLDVFTLIDLRKKLLRIKEGETVELSDEEWTALQPVLKQPSAFSPEFIHCAEVFFRSFLEAPTKL